MLENNSCRCLPLYPDRGVGHYLLHWFIQLFHPFKSLACFLISLTFFQRFCLSPQFYLSNFYWAFLFLYFFYFPGLMTFLPNVFSCNLVTWPNRFPSINKLPNIFIPRYVPHRTRTQGFNFLQEFRNTTFTTYKSFTYTFIKLHRCNVFLSNS